MVITNINKKRGIIKTLSMAWSGRSVAEAGLRGKRRKRLIARSFAALRSRGVFLAGGGFLADLALYDSAALWGRAGSPPVIWQWLPLPGWLFGFRAMPEAASGKGKAASRAVKASLRLL
jgi:hypothetical protein